MDRRSHPTQPPPQHDSLVRIVAQRVLCAPVVGIWHMDQDDEAKTIRVGIRVNQADFRAGFNVPMTVAMFQVRSLSGLGIMVNVFINIDPPGIKVG